MAIPFPDRPPPPPREPRSLKKAVLLALFFGPLGLMYASVPAGLFLLFTAFVVALFTVGTGLIGVWALSVFVAVVLTWELEE